MTPSQAMERQWRQKAVQGHRLTGMAQRDLLQRLYNAGDLSYACAARWALECAIEAELHIAACRDPALESATEGGVARHAPPNRPDGGRPGRLPWGRIEDNGTVLTR